MQILLEASRDSPKDLPTDMEFFQVMPAPTNLAITVANLTSIRHHTRAGTEALVPARVAA